MFSIAKKKQVCYNGGRESRKESTVQEMIQSLDRKVINQLAVIGWTEKWNQTDLPHGKDAAREMRRIKRFWAAEIRLLPENLRNYITQEGSAEEILSFLRACRAELDIREEAEKKAFFANGKGIGDEILKALWDERGALDFDFSTPDTVKLMLDDAASIYRVLILEGCCPDITSKEHEDMFTLHGIRKTDGGYILECILEYWNEDADDYAERKTEIFFAHVSIRTEIFALTGHSLFADAGPWTILADLTRQIVHKSEISMQYLSEKEAAILPLCREITAIFWNYEPGMTFPRFRERLLQIGDEKAIKLLDDTKTEEQSFFVRSDREKKINRYLCKAKFEPLWREIFDAVLDSQSVYPAKAERLCSKKQTDALRRAVTLTLRDAGFAGEYPCFERTEDLLVPRLVHCYDESYIVMAEKSVKEYVYCTESCDEDGRTLTFLTGTDFTRGRVTKDVYSCMFEEKDRRHFTVTDHVLPKGEKIQTDSAPSIAALLLAVIKRAACRRLSKQDKRAIEGTNGFTVAAWGLFIFLGLFFGLFMTLGMALIGALVILIFEGSDGLSVLAEPSIWIFCFLFCSIAFGTAMGIVERASMRK